MRITNDDFIRLIDAVEAQNGEYVDDTCHADEIIYDDPKTKGKIVAMTSGCEKPTVFEIPYDPTEEVAVPEPILEPDPDRSEWPGPDGEMRQTRRSKKVELEDGSKQVLWEVVVREGEDIDPSTMGRPKVTVCAQDDNVGMWPRFAGVLQDRGSR